MLLYSSLNLHNRDIELSIRKPNKGFKMKKELLVVCMMGLVYLTGCGGDSSEGESTAVHYQGANCLTCHGGTAVAAEGKYFRSGVTVYSDLNSSIPLDGYSVRLVMDNNATINYIPGRGIGNANSGLYSTTLDGYTTNSFTAQLLDANANVVNSSGTNTHDSSRLSCNTCHTAAGLNGAPGRIYPNVTTTLPPVGTLSFANDVMPVLTASCQSCHGTNGAFSITTASATYTNINSFSGIDTTTPANSYLLLKATNMIATSHGGGAVWTTSDPAYITVKTWIEQGALNN